MRGCKGEGWGVRTETEKKPTRGRQSESKRREDVREEKVGGMACVCVCVCVHLFLKVRSHKDESDSLTLREVERCRRLVHTRTYVHIHLCICRQISMHTHTNTHTQMHITPGRTDFTFSFSAEIFCLSDQKVRSSNTQQTSVI